MSVPFYVPTRSVFSPHILLPFSIFCFWVKIVSCWEKNQVPARGGCCLSERFHKYNSLPEHRTERLKSRWVSGEWDPRSAAQVCITWLSIWTWISLQNPQNGLGGDGYWTTQKKSFSSFSETLSWCIWSRISLWFGCAFYQIFPLDSFSRACPPSVAFLGTCLFKSFICVELPCDFIISHSNIMLLLSKCDCVLSGGLEIRHVVHTCFISFPPAF